MTIALRVPLVLQRLLSEAVAADDVARLGAAVARGRIEAQDAAGPTEGGGRMVLQEDGVRGRIDLHEDFAVWLGRIV